MTSRRTPIKLDRFTAKRKSRWPCDARVIHARFACDEITNLAARRFARDNISLGPLYYKILRPPLNTKWSTVQSCCPFRRKTENYWRNSLTIIIWNSISFIEFNQKSIQNDGSTLLGRPLNLLVAKLRVNLRGSSNRLWSNLIAIRVDTQLKNGFGVQLLSRQRVLKTTELQEQYKKHVTTTRDVAYLIWVILVSKLFL